MTRSIVLRFDSKCVDCGHILSAGTTARWFGKGRVSCCGKGAPAAATADSPAPADSSVYVRCRRCGRYGTCGLNLCAPLPPAPARPAFGASTPPPSFPHWVAQIATDTGIPAEAIAIGMQPAHVAILATKMPNRMLLVRLASGARFTAAAAQAGHIIRCVEESLVDKVRDVTVPYVEAV